MVVGTGTAGPVAMGTGPMSRAGCGTSSPAPPHPPPPPPLRSGMQAVGLARDVPVSPIVTFSHHRPGDDRAGCVVGTLEAGVVVGARVSIGVGSPLAAVAVATCAPPPHAMTLAGGVAVGDPDCVLTLTEPHLALFFPHPAAGPTRFPAPFVLQHTIRGMRSAYAVPTPVRSTFGPKRLHPSAVSTTGEPAFTTFHSGMQACVDFIWYSSDTLVRMGLVECLPPDVLFALGTLPSRHVPSDHMCLVTDFKLVAP